MMEVERATVKAPSRVGTIPPAAIAELVSSEGLRRYVHRPPSRPQK